MLQTEVISSFALTDRVIHGPDFSVDIVFFGSSEVFRQEHYVPPLLWNAMAADAVEQKTGHNDEDPADGQCGKYAVMLIHDAGDIGACIQECIATADRMKRENPNVFVPQQFENLANPAVQRDVTGHEILEDLGCPADGFCSGIGTGGTITGIGETLKAANPNMLIWAVEPENAAILSGGSIGTHVQMGIGDGLVPAILNQNIYSDIYIVTDEQALQTAKDLASREGIMCGISSGTNVAAAITMAEKLGKGKKVVTILPDTAERYFSTELFD